MTTPLRICLFGASPDTGNMGVSALCFSAVHGLARRDPGADLVVFDHGKGLRADETSMGEEAFSFARCGGNHSRRYYRGDNYWNMRVSARLGGLVNVGARKVREASAIWDVSGGDSFTDLYGDHRFSTVMMPKRLAMENDVPLVLLPQTFGPFECPQKRAAASEVVRRARMAWARDERSFETLRELAGAQFDEDRHRCGVDLAFGLETRKPAAPIPDLLLRWWEEPTSEVLGFNISGLILNRPQAAQSFGLSIDYREAVRTILRTLLKDGNVRLVLTPHVLTPMGHYESDLEACLALAEELGEPERVLALPIDYDQSELKWIISRFQWFCGTRMHSTIAGLSSGVPTASLAYSGKTRGVFETCDQASCVADARNLQTDEAIEVILESYRKRHESRDRLERALPKVRERVESQMNELVESSREARRVA